MSKNAKSAIEIMEEMNAPEPANTPKEDKITELLNPRYSLYGLGGAAVKIINRMDDPCDQFNITLIDTSKAEALLIKDDRIKGILLTDGNEGSGGDRGANYDMLSVDIPKLLDSTEPTDINYVVFSASGATGSTEAYIVIKELLKRNLGVVAIASFNPNNTLRLGNSKNTLKSLHNLAVEFKTNIPVYLATEEDLTIQDINTAGMIQVLDTMLNPGIIGLDMSDRLNFLNPSNIKDVGVAGLLSLKFTTKKTFDTDPVSGLILTPRDEIETLSSKCTIAFDGILDSIVMSRINNILKRDISSAALYNSLDPVYQYYGGIAAKHQEAVKEETVRNNNSRGIMKNMGSGGIAL